MTVIGVTGTNGKTSTCYMIYNTLLAAGYKVAMMTTVSTAIMGETEEQLGHMTTADPRLLNKKIAAMRDAGVQYLVLEVSSHALAQGRVFGIPFDIAVMTNVTPEHLDYHRTFARYRAAKVKLFRMMADNAKHGGRGVGIVNADDPSAKWFIRECPTALTYGINGGDLRATRIKLTAKGVEYYTRLDKQAFHIKVKIPGRFYVYNSLAAVAACHALGLSKQQIEQGIANLDGVEGRMNRIETGLGFDVIVDYAHTPDAYQQVLPDVKQAAKGKVILICGVEGDRDNSKFADMGRIAADNTDIVILTEQDAGKHNVRQLSELMAKGLREKGKTDGKDLLFIDDRRAAIEQAVSLADKGDVILLFGMGHEKVMDRANGPEPWNDTEQAKAVITEFEHKSKKSKTKSAKAAKKTEAGETKANNTAKSAKNVKKSAAKTNKKTSKSSGSAKTSK